MNEYTIPILLLLLLWLLSWIFKKPKKQEIWISVDEVAHLLGCTNSDVCQLAYARVLKCESMRTGIAINRESFNKYFNELGEI